MLEVPADRIIQYDYETFEEVGRYHTVRQAAEDNYIAISEIYKALKESEGKLHNKKLFFIYPKNQEEARKEAMRLRAIELADADEECSFYEIATQLTYEFDKRVQSAQIGNWVASECLEVLNKGVSHATTQLLKDAFKYARKLQKYKDTSNVGRVIYHKKYIENGGKPKLVIKKSVVKEVYNNYFATDKETVLFVDVIEIK